MMKKIVFPLLLFLFACTSSPVPEKKAEKPASRPKHKITEVKTEVNPWAVNSYAAKAGEEAGRKYVRYEAVGTFSDNDGGKGPLYAEVFVDKINAGIFLHESQKSAPVQKFSDPVHITVTGSGGKELKMTSTRGWNKSGGILIERNNNDYSQFRIFLLQDSGMVNIRIVAGDSTKFSFDINSEGFGRAFGKI